LSWTSGPPLWKHPGVRRHPLASFISSFLSAAADLIYPPKCPLCDGLVSLRHETCVRCRPRIQRLAGDARLDLPSRVWLGRARSCFAHDGPVRDALHGFKYECRVQAAEFFARRMAEEARGMGAFDIVAPVPMSGRRMRARGFNAAAILARRVCRIRGIGLDASLLRRVAGGTPQVGLPREERVRNVRGAFSVPERAAGRVRGARVLVVDDVLTTGATLNECARALMKAGAARVDAVTVARAL
jgi:ComF family protein